jgi:hypothetical protein
MAHTTPEFIIKKDCLFNCLYVSFSCTQIIISFLADDRRDVLIILRLAEMIRIPAFSGGDVACLSPQIPEPEKTFSDFSS